MIVLNPTHEIKAGCHIIFVRLEIATRHEIGWKHNTPERLTTEMSAFKYVYCLDSIRNNGQNIYKWEKHIWISWIFWRHVCVGCSSYFGRRDKKSLVINKSNFNGFRKHFNDIKHEGEIEKIFWHTWSIEFSIIKLSFWSLSILKTNQYESTWRYIDLSSLVTKNITCNSSRSRFNVFVRDW